MNLHCFTVNFSSRNVSYCTITNAHLKSKSRRICMGNMLKNTANFKLKLQCFTANFSSRNVYYCASAVARSKNYILRTAQKTITLFFFSLQFMGEIWRTPKQTGHPLHHTAFPIVSTVGGSSQRHSQRANLFRRCNGTRCHEKRRGVPAFL